MGHGARGLAEPASAAVAAARLRGGRRAPRARRRTHGGGRGRRQAATGEGARARPTGQTGATAAMLDLGRRCCCTGAAPPHANMAGIAAARGGAGCRSGGRRTPARAGAAAAAPFLQARAPCAAALITGLATHCVPGAPKPVKNPSARPPDRGPDRQAPWRSRTSPASRSTTNACSASSRCRRERGEPPRAAARAGAAQRAAPLCAAPLPRTTPWPTHAPATPTPLPQRVVSAVQIAARVMAELARAADADRAGLVEMAGEFLQQVQVRGPGRVALGPAGDAGGQGARQGRGTGGG
jgi:hypothetical protein